MTNTTREQRKAIFRKYQQDPDGSSCYRDFRNRVEAAYFDRDRPPTLVLHWCGMWLGIEPDGYTDS